MDQKILMMSSSKKNLVIFSEERTWHTNQIALNMKDFSISTNVKSLAKLSIDIDVEKKSFYKRGFKKAPLGFFVRGIDAGTFEQTTKRLAILHQLSSLGYLVINSGKGIENSVDKGMTSFLLRSSGLPTPDAWVFECQKDARDIINKIINDGFMLVSKPLFGSQGRDIFLIDTPINNVSELNEKFKLYNGLLYVQKFVGNRDQQFSGDLRVFVIGDKAIAGMERRGTDWVHNVAKGGVCREVNLSVHLKNLAVTAAKVVGLEIAGIDLIRDNSTKFGFQIIEVNGVPSWAGLQKVSPIDISHEIASYLKVRMEEHNLEL